MVEHRHKECKKNCRKCAQQIQEKKYARKLYHSTRSKKTLSKSDRNVKTFLQTEYLNQSRDATQFWHRYEKVIGRKTNNTVEPIFDSNSSTYIFDDEIISNRLHDYHIVKSASSLNYDDSFKMSVEEKLQQTLNHVECSSSQIFFGEEHIKDAINKANKNSSPGPDKITSELILNGGKQVIFALTLLLQACYLIGYFPKLWKMENRIYVKKMDKVTYHIENSYRSISLTNFFCKIYKRILLELATNILEENQFFEGKNLYANQKNKNTPKAFLPLVEQMHEAIANGEYGVVIMADLEGAFDSVWREGALYKLHMAGINNTLLAVLSSFLTDRVCRNLVNSRQGPWLETQLGVPQGSLLSQLIFLVYTSDLTLEEEKPQSQVK